MTKNSDVMTSADTPQQQLPDNELLKSGLRVVGTGVGVSFALYPLGYGQFVVQTYNKTPAPQSIFSKTLAISSMILASLKRPQDHVHALGYSMKAGVAKNTVLSHNEQIHNQVDYVVNGKKSTEILDRNQFDSINVMMVAEADKIISHDDKPFNTFSKRDLPIALTASATMSLLDTAVTAYPSAKAIGIFIYKNNMPKLSTYGEMARFAKMGIGVRFAGNFSNAAGFILSGHILEPMIAYVLPENTSPEKSKNTATIIAGTISGLIGNSFKVILNNVMLQANIETLTAPSGMKIAKQLYANHGKGVFLRGSIWSIFQTIIAYKVIHGVGEFIQKPPAWFVKPVNSAYDRAKEVFQHTQMTLQDVPSSVYKVSESVVDVIRGRKMPGKVCETIEAGIEYSCKNKPIFATLFGSNNITQKTIPAPLGNKLRRKSK
ncbi:MAG: hypothetical protein A3F12_04145 [Gammaproteobacteria bacterium RIFCSPHIGHO2_12_FULL_38_14]|nr:MAG: hypothetical protein A3F12_04145 [Gammaproteobacteria bacterium RIFCSPHIGHO2_12_FULL_38_14]